MSAFLPTFDINQAYLLFFYYKQRLITKDRWENDIRDMKGMFANKMVYEQWNKAQNRFTKEFREFVNEQVLVVILFIL